MKRSLTAIKHFIVGKRRSSFSEKGIFVNVGTALLSKLKQDSSPFKTISSQQIWELKTTSGTKVVKSMKNWPISPKETTTWPLFLFKNNLLRIIYNLVGASKKFFYSLPSYALRANKREKNEATAGQNVRVFKNEDFFKALDFRKRTKVLIPEIITGPRFDKNKINKYPVSVFSRERLSFRDVWFSAT